jgi:hypothetical protein
LKQNPLMAWSQLASETHTRPSETQSPAVQLGVAAGHSELPVQLRQVIAVASHTCPAGHVV